MKSCLGGVVLAGLVALSAGAGIEEEILSARGTAGKPAVVRLAKGVHALTRTLELGPANSHLRIVGEEGAVLSGGRAVRFTEADGLWRAKVPAGLDFKLLYVNGSRATRAVEPDGGGFHLMQAPVGDDHHGFRADPADVAQFVGKSATELADVELHIWQSWDSVRLPPLAVAADGTVTTGYKHWPYFIWHAYPPRYRIENFRAALDTPGEWYFDKAAGEILYLPRPGERVETAEGVIPLVDVLVRIDGREDSRVEDVTFEGVGFELTDAGFPSDGVIRQGASLCQGAAVTVDRAKGIRFENCAFTRLGQHGVWFRDDCHDAALVRSRVEDIGSGAVRIGSQTWTNTVPAETITSGIVVRDCILRDGGRWTPEGCGILLQNARDCEIVHNEISGFYYTGVSLGWTWGYRETCVRNITVAYNHIHHLGWGYLADMGAIYSLGDCDGSRIVGNYIHDLLPGDYSGWGAHGLYTDEGSHGMVFASNFVRRASTGFYQHYGRDNVFRANVFADPRDSFVHRGRNEDHLSFVCEGNVFASDSARVLYSGEINGGAPTEKALFRGNLVCAPGLAEKAFFGRTFADWQAKGEDAGTRRTGSFDLAAAEARAKAAAGVTGPADWRALAEAVVYPEMVAPPNPPRYSMPYDEGFEKVEVAKGMVGEFGASKGLAVVSGRATEGTRSLLATVTEGLDVLEQPRLELWTTGTDRRSVLEFDFRSSPGVDVAFEFKDSNPIGKPQLTVNEILVRDGTLLAGGKSAAVPADGGWWRLRVEHDFTGSSPAYAVSVLRDGKALAKLEGLPIDSAFRQWMFFAADTRSAKAGTWEMDGFRFRAVPCRDEGAGERPCVMMRFSSAQTRSSEEWALTARAFAEHPGCCDDVWFSTGESFPSVDWHRRHVARLREAARDLRRLDIGVSLQFEATIGHGDDFPTDEEKELFDKPWTGWTGSDGTECRYCSCPRQPAFLKRLEEISGLYACIEPSVVWIDDDLRPTNHMPVSGRDSPGCWCATCVAAFAAEEKRDWTRESLLADYRCDAALRDRWEDFSCRSLAQAACVIARAFRKVSPKTRMGLQTAEDRIRMTHVVVRALAGATGEKVGVRLGGGAYHDTDPFEQLAKSARAARTRRLMAIEDIVGTWCTEVESYPRAYGSRSVRSIALESFASLAWGFDTTSLFVMDRRSETDALYSRYLLGPLVGVTKFLNDYRTASRGTVPAGLTCPMDEGDRRLLSGIPILPGFGRSWGTASAERPAGGWGGGWREDFRRDLIPPYETMPSAGIQAVRDNLSFAAPVELLSPFVGLLLPRVSETGEVRTIGLVGARLDEQRDVVLRVETAATVAVWHELGAAPQVLDVVSADGCRQVTIPSLGSWNCGYLAFASEAPATRFRYASWNVGHFALGEAPRSLIDGVDAEVRASEYRRFLEDVGADALGVCEFSDDFTRDGRRKTVEAVFPRYPLRYVGPSQSHGWHQNAQFWKTFSPVTSRVRQFSERCDDVHWLETRVLCGTQEVVFVQTHLDWKPLGEGTSPCRRSQMRELIAVYRDDPHVVISGDFNVGIRRLGADGKRLPTVDDPEEYRIFTEAGYTLGNDGRFKTVQSGGALDNIIVKGLGIGSFKVWPRYDLSDHALVSAVLELPEVGQ